MSVLVKVVEGKMQGKYSFECEKCGYCGGNYATPEVAEMYAQLHSQMEVPEHR